MSEFKYVAPTQVLIDGQSRTIQMENGMTGIGSRTYYVDGKNQFHRCVTQSEDLTNGNHAIYTIKWRDTPWDKVDVIIHEAELPVLLSEENKWREPTKRTFN